MRKFLGQVYYKLYAQDNSIVSRVLAFKLIVTGLLSMLVELFIGFETYFTSFVVANLITTVLAVIVNQVFNIFGKSNLEVFLGTLLPLGIVSW